MNTVKVTSATLHQTDDGPNISYTYSIIDNDTGAAVQKNIRKDIILTGSEDMLAAKEHFDAIFTFINTKRKEQRQAELDALRAELEV